MRILFYSFVIKNKLFKTATRQKVCPKELDYIISKNKIKKKIQDLRFQICSQIYTVQSGYNDSGYNEFQALTNQL